MNGSPVSRQAVVTHNCGERGKASLSFSVRREDGRFVRPPATPLALLPPVALGAILLAEGDANLAAG